MTDCNDLESWMLEQGGPAIRLRIYGRRHKNESEKEIQNAVSMLLELSEVNSTLDLLNAFRVQSRDKKTIEHLVHYYKDTCIDNFFSRLLDLGFRAGIPVFDEKIQPVAALFSDLLSGDQDYCYYYSLMLHRFFFMAGYASQDVMKSMEQRMNAVHKSAKERIFDIYQDGSSLPKVPGQWLDRGIIKDALNPFSREAKSPLPTIYDISALAYFPEEHKNSSIRDRIDDIVEYVLDPEFQKIPEYYGLLWNRSRRIYHACGWGPALPLYENYDRPGHIGGNSVLNYLKLMSNFTAAHQSKWFVNGMNFVRQFRTDRGTYIFPKEFLDGKSAGLGSMSDMMGMNAKLDEAFLNESNMSLKRSEREILIRELVSTLNMLEINHMQYK